MKKITFIFVIFFITTLTTAKKQDWEKKYHVEPVDPPDCSTTDKNSGCAVCDPDENVCKYCRAGYGYNETSGACTLCARAYYSMGGQSDCLPCNSYGLCSKLSAEEKKWKCPYYSYKEGSDRCEYCPKGKFTHMAQYECFQCPKHCIECEGGIKGGKCIQCEEGYGLRDGRSGCFKCDSTRGEYSDGTTRCISIYEPEVFFFANKTYTFTGKDDTQNATGNTPVSCDAAKNEIAVDGKCVNCSTVAKHCAVCSVNNKVVTCTACHQPFVLQDGHCIPCVKKEHFVATDDGKGKCERNIFGCNYQVNNTCYDCDRDFVLRGGKCILLSDCDVVGESTCEKCTNGESISTNGLCSTTKNCKYSQDETCLTCDNKYTVNTTEGSNGSCSVYQHCESSRGDYCLKTENNYRVNRTIGNVMTCEESKTCLTPHKDQMP